MSCGRLSTSNRRFSCNALSSTLTASLDAENTNPPNPKLGSIRLTAKFVSPWAPTWPALDLPAGLSDEETLFPNAWPELKLKPGVAGELIILFVVVWTPFGAVFVIDWF